MTNVQGAKKHRATVITREEFEDALESARGLDSHPYYSLRDQAILCILWLTGKRAEEVAQLKLDDIKLSGGLLRITFMVAKKRNSSEWDRRRTKAVSLTDPYTEPVTRYYHYMLENHPDCPYLFPTTTLSNLTGQVIIRPETHLNRESIWRRVTLHGPETWTHLYRETQGARIVRSQNNQIAALFAVKQRLDLEKLDTAMKYIQRYGIDIIQEAKIG